jgi:hypothetical protein
MSLLDESETELLSLSNALADLAKHGTGCITQDWYLDRNSEEKANFDACLQLVHAKKITYAALHRLCKSYGLEISERSFREHFQTHCHDQEQS